MSLYARTCNDLFRRLIYIAFSLYILLFNVYFVQSLVELTKAIHRRLVQQMFRFNYGRVLFVVEVCCARHSRDYKRFEIEIHFK